jgi:site-specific recombinase XerD
MEGYVFHMQANGLTASTIKNRLNAAKMWLGWCEREKVNYLTASRNEMMAWLGSLYADHASSTVRLYTLCLRQFYDYLLEAGMVKKNEARQIGVKKQVSKPVEPFSDDDLRGMMGACTSYTDRAIFFLLLGGGLRRSEIQRIKRDDVHFDVGTVRVFGKGSKYRMIAPGQDAMASLRIALEFTDTLCPSTSHDYVERRVKYWAKKAGVTSRCHAHRFRYTFATRFCELGGGIDLLQTILGHSSLQMSMYYSRSGREQRALKAQVAYNPADLLNEVAAG